MKNLPGPIPELSRRVRGLVEQIFPPVEQQRVRELLHEFHWPPEPLIDERIHLDILEICGGKIERVHELVQLAKVDWRDLIMVAEYELKDGKIVRNERCDIRLAEVSVAKKLRGDRK